jgi:hypothetical protein
MFHLTWSRLVVPRFYNLHLASQSPRQRRILEFRPSRLSFPPSTDRLYFRLRGLTDITLKACCLRCSAAACCLHLVSTVTVEDRRFGYGPVAPSHLVRSGPSRGPAGLAGLSGSSLQDPPGPGPATLPARPLELDRTCCLRARPATLVPFRRRLSRAACALAGAPTYPESPVASSCERVLPSSE